jgi:hypothetical protein
MELFTVLLVIHVLSAVMLIGPAGAFEVLGKKASELGPNGGTEFLRAMLEIERKFVIPGAIISGITGVWMMVEVNLDKVLFDNTWLWTSILAYLIIMGLATGVDTPAIKRIVAASDAGQQPAEKDIKLTKTLGPILGLLTAFIVVMMVWKPGLTF